MNPLFHTGFSISDSLKSVRKSVLIYATIIQYMFCGECLNRDFDVVAGIKEVEKCPICGSKNIWIENP